MLEEISLGAKLLGFGKKYWPWIIGALVVAGLVTWAVVAHSSAKKAFGDQRYADGVAFQQKQDAAAIAVANARANAINSKLRTKSDEEARNISSSADDVRVRGPGAATCSSVAAPPTSSGGRVAPGGTGPAGVVQVRDSGGADLIALPFADAVTVIEQCALNRNEVLAWRNSDQQQAQPQETKP